MKKVALINAAGYGSTGNIASNIIKEYKGNIRLYCFYIKEDRENAYPIKINKVSDLISHAISRIDGKDGFHYHSFTKKLIKELDEFKPDLLHIHNLHGYYLNVPMLIDYINKNHIKVIWTLHDFWVMTGRCAHPSSCDKYLTGCHNCKRGDIYPYAIFHNEAKMFIKKKEMINSIEDLTFVSPSEYVKREILTSHLKDKEIKVINNGINTSLFFYEKNDLKNQLNISKDKKVLLNVSMPIYKNKGVDYINRLAEELDINKYQIVCIGPLDNGITLNKNIINIPYVPQDQLHLYYSMADLLINPTLADNYPTVDMEAICCELPVVSFDTGGSKEIVDDTVGKITPYKDYDAFKNAVISVEKSQFKKESFLNKKEKFDQKHMIEQYLEFYK